MLQRLGLSEKYAKMTTVSSLPRFVNDAFVILVVNLVLVEAFFSTK